LTEIGLKVFYLRTRVRRTSQQRMADDLRIRQATLSNIERGRSFPTTALLVELCKYFDVTPTYLVDDERGIPPQATDRWSLRNTVVTAGMWIEAPEDSVVHLENGKILCPLLPGESFYDDEAKSERETASVDEVEELYEARVEEEKALARELAKELQAHPQRRPPKA